MNPYKTLNINPDATLDEIKKAYKDLSKTHHPDTGGSEDKFKEILTAYQMLCDPEKRKIFDEYGFDSLHLQKVRATAYEFFKASIIHDVDNIIDYSIILADKRKDISYDEIEKRHKGIEVIDKALKRIAYSPTENFLKGVLDLEKITMYTEIAKFNDDIELIDDSIKMLKEYIFYIQNSEPVQQNNSRGFFQPIFNITKSDGTAT